MQRIIPAEGAQTDLVLGRALSQPFLLQTHQRPEQLAEKWEEGFDAVLVDAPCSGEGMFRRDPETRNEWTAEKAEGCILADAQVGCPPCIPIVMSGEKIDSNAIECFRYYGMDRCRIVKSQQLSAF